MSLQGITILVVGLLCLPVIGMAQGADNRRVSEDGLIDIRVQGGGFGGASPADINAVLQSTAGELWRHCAGAQLPGFDVYYRSDHPQTDSKLTAEGRIAIGLAARDNHWAQYTFQFAHECCHALINYSSDHGELARHPRHANLWLEESLCETASLFTLRALSRSWLTTPPYPAWRDYAPWFFAYSEQRLARTGRHLPAGTPFMVWFRANEPALRQDSTRRDRNAIVAAQLLPIFERETRGWGALAFLNRAANPNQSLSQLFVDWRSRCPPALQRFVAKVAAVFEVEAQASGGRRWLEAPCDRVRVSGARQPMNSLVNESD